MNTDIFTGKNILITGGTGSFGNTMVRYLLKNTQIAQIRVFSRDEKKQDDMRKELNNPKLRFYIGDVRQKESVDEAVNGAHFVFHAAALKQVPSCEFFPMQAVQTNVLGASNVLEAAARFNVERMVVLSTDKAVYPINAMGLTKALMEKVMIAKSRTSNNTIFCGTRYGNVMASRGSVIPLFVEQIKTGKPLTITDPEMTRFLMTLDDSVALVLYAFSNGQPGDMFVQKAPASTIAVLAQALKELYKADNPISIIGTRHGEKLYESLVNREEMAKAFDMGDYYRIPADTRDLNYNLYFETGENKISQAKEYTSHNTTRLDVEGTKQLLLKLGFIRKDLGLE